MTSEALDSSRPTQPLDRCSRGATSEPRRSPRTIPCSLLAVLGMVLFASFPSAAQPRLRVRAETRLELAQERVDSGVHLRGALLDDLGLPLASRELDIEVQPADDPAALVRERLRTDREGRFSLDVPLASHRTVRLRAIFSGDENHEVASVANGHHDRPKFQSDAQDNGAGPSRLIDAVEERLQVRLRSASAG